MTKHADKNHSNNNKQGEPVTGSEGTYIGSRLMGLPHGFGKYSFGNGEIFVGEWHNGYMHGEII